MSRRPIRIVVGLFALLTLVLVTAVAGARGVSFLDGEPNQGPDPIRKLPEQPTPDEALRKLGLSGYADRTSVQPGQALSFKVSSEAERYRAEIVRLFHADTNPRGPGLKEEGVDSPVTGEYPGRHQDLGLGSYVIVPTSDAVERRGSFTVTAWIAPSTIPGSRDNPLAGPRTPAKEPRPQGIVSKLSADGRSGYGLAIANDGSLVLRLGDGKRLEEVTSGVPLRAWAPSFPEEGAIIEKIEGGDASPQMTNGRWSFVAASYDAGTGRVLLYQDPQGGVVDRTRRLVERTTAIRRLGVSAEPLLIAAGRRGPNGRPGELYNGKVDEPRIYRRALNAGELRAIAAGDGPGGAVARWDFARGIRSDRVTDVAGGPRGRAVNLPTRGVTGHDWKRRELDFRRAGDQYGAIHFHQDDLRDARWATAFRYRVPDDAESGIYAAKLRAGKRRFYVPFYVRPRRAQARIALLIETNTYLAYGQTGVPNLVGPSSLSVYSRHADGSGTAYASRLRPITSLQPGGDPRHFVADTFIVDWLHEKGFKVDIITDEDLNRDGARLLDRYAVVLTSTHPEYPTARMQEAYERYLRTGGRIMYLGGNGFYWVTGLGDGGRYLEVRRRDGTQTWQAAPGESHLTTTGEEGGLWRFRGRPPQDLFGVGFDAQAYGSPKGPAETGRPYSRRPDSFEPETAFVFDGVGRDESIGGFPNLAEQSPGAAGDELDRVDYTLGSPPSTYILASATGFPDTYQHVVEEVSQDHSTGGGTINPLVRADLAYLKYQGGGAVFSTGSITWAGALSYHGYANNVSRITENVLRRFTTDAALP